jgi:hypothetical protein
MRIRNLGTVARTLQRLATSETKDRPKAVSVIGHAAGAPASLTFARSRRSTGTRKIPILPRLRRFDRIALAGKSLGGLEGLFPGRPPRNRAPADIVIECELPDDRAVFGPDLEVIGMLDDFHGANKALSGTFGNRPMGCSQQIQCITTCSQDAH